MRPRRPGRGTGCRCGCRSRCGRCRPRPGRTPPARIRSSGPDP
ncbi:hypothetical protein ACFFX0_18275 [Citricoccus parietis]|uniref:Uncharacterized protein n=1 Tax=Citricoccus parietis TaxID=592307 RepID=A0ABV5G291_9MICC